MHAKHSLNTDNSQEADNVSAALALVADGIAVFPVGPDKRPLVKGWQDKATTDPDQIKAWWRDRPDVMPAIPTGKRNGIAVLDVDRKNGKDGLAELAALGLDVEALSDTQVATAGDGRHIYLEWPEGMGNSAAGLPPGLDVRGEGGYVVAPGAINGKGAYRLLKGSLTAKLPPWPEVLPIRRKPVDAGEAQPTGLPWSAFAEVVRAVPNDGDAFPTRDDWLNMGFAIHAESGGSLDGNDLWHEWSAQHGTYDPTETDRVWESFKADRPGGLTGWFAIGRARQLGFRHPDLDRLLARDLDDCWTAEELEEIKRVSAEESLAKTIEEDRRLLDPEAFDLLWGQPSHLTFLSPSDCEGLPARRYVVKGLIGEGDIAAVVGAPGAGKSLLAPYLGFAVAQGVEVFGRRTRQGRVFYVAAEDSHGMRARVQALRSERGEAEAFKLVEGVSDLLSDGSEDLKALTVAVEDQRPALIVIDTLAVGFPGLEENEAKAMGRVVAVARSLTRWGAAVVLVHHDTKDGNGLPRGHSILNGALDMSLHLKRDGKVVRVRPTKNRNGSTDQELAFSVGTIQMGTDEDGDTIWTAICDEENTAHLPNPGKPLPPSAKAALDILTDLSPDGQLIPKAEWRAACIASDAVSGAEKIDDRRQAFRRALEQLARRKLFISQGEQVRLTESPDMLLGGDNDD